MTPFWSERYIFTLIDEILKKYKINKTLAVPLPHVQPDIFLCCFGGLTQLYPINSVLVKTSWKTK